MNFKYLILILGIGFFTTTASAQKYGSRISVDGRWEGKITQDDGGVQSEYYMEIDVKQKGSKVEGYAYVSFEDHYARMKFKGRVRGGIMVMLEEYEITEKTDLGENWDWCLKKMQLVVKYKDDKMYLEGYWNGVSQYGACIPGKVFLEKPEDRA